VVEETPPADKLVDGMLMQELSECKARIEKLESLNAALVHRSSQLEADAKERKRQRDEAVQKVTNLELELRMAKMEAEQAVRRMEEKATSLEEMQLEIDLVTKASVNANVRAAHGEEIAKTVKTDREHVHQLEAQCKALQEWALASAESKRLSQERVRWLEMQLRKYQEKEGEASATDNPVQERKLFATEASLVVGAGDYVIRVVELGEYARQVTIEERVVLRWKFDLVPSDKSCEFKVVKGKLDKKAARGSKEFLMKQREVKGGAAGELEHAFSVGGGCTFVWSNAKAWITPKTVKYSLEALAVED